MAGHPSAGRASHGTAILLSSPRSSQKATRAQQGFGGQGALSFWRANHPMITGVSKIGLLDQFPAEGDATVARRLIDDMHPFLGSVT